MTSLRKELGHVPAVEEIKELLIEGYEKILGTKLTPSEPTEEEKQIWEGEVKPKHLSREWLHMRRLRHEELGRGLRIADGVRMAEVRYKAKKLIRVTAEVMDDEILDILISGDFFMIPEEGLQELESALRGAKMNRNELLQRLHEFYEKSGVQTPGVTPEDFVEALMKLKELLEKYPSTIRPYAESESDDSGNKFHNQIPFLESPN